MKTVKGELYYYIYNPEEDSPVIVELEAVKDDDAELFLSFIVKSAVMGSFDEAGHKDAIYPGAVISANQLNGVGFSGPGSFIFTQQNSIKYIFVPYIIP